MKKLKRHSSTYEEFCWMHCPHPEKPCKGTCAEIKEFCSKHRRKKGGRKANAQNDEITACSGVYKSQCEYDPELTEDFTYIIPQIAYHLMD